MSSAVVVLLVVSLFVLALLAMRFYTSASHLKSENQRLQQESDGMRERLDLSHDKVVQLESACSSLQTQLDEEVLRSKEKAREQEEDLHQALNMVEMRLQKTAQQLLEQRAEALGKENSEQIAQIMAPLQATLGEMRTSVNVMREQSVRGTAQVEKSVENLIRQAAEIGSRADNLADAIRSNHKQQGNMGEVVLAELLQSQGLEPGVHFTVQGTLRDSKGHALENADTGSKMVPDILLHFPDKKDVVIDSKVSLDAFLDYVEATDDSQRASALARHIQSVRDHVTGLSKKNYQKYSFADHEMLPYVIMFMPQENALQLALSNEPSLWRKAFEKNVFIAGGQTLIAALRLIELAWRGQRQRENERVIIAQAEEMLQRVALFCNRYEEIGNKIEKLSNAYEEAKRTLHSGRKSILVPAKRLTEIGVKPPKELPAIEE